MLAEYGGPWPPMLWIGGAQGAGKSRLAWTLAHTQDLPLHPVDLWSYDHLSRLPPPGSTLDDELVLGPDAAADAFEATSRARLGLVLSDVASRALGQVPALVEGPQLMPRFAGRLPRGWAVWLIPDPARTRLTRHQRLVKEQLPAGPEPASDHPRLASVESQAKEQLPTGTEPASDHPRLASVESQAKEQLPTGPGSASDHPRLARVERLAQRDAVLAIRIRQHAARSGLPVIEVPENPDWAAIAAAAEAALAPALRDSPRLAPGHELREQRRRENAAASRQGRLWQQAAGLAATPPYPFACECGGSGCQEVWTATPNEYNAACADRPLVVPEHR